MAEVYTDYVTQDGDRLDLIAWKAYGDPWRWKELLQANPWLPIAAIYPEGLRLIVPVDQATTVPSTIETTNNLPPWKQ